ncbi:diaminopimelate epimerase [Caulobacter sp. KR2-114]|uniref:diaminopimelate epimerase n=1 Tax=Caulobacter sp. KR2-114 TaxID=3400912 RepID=UPI003C123571
MSRPFLKMNGLGNDFVVVEARSAPFRPSEAEARAIADRASGVGCDQIIGIEPSDRADAFMRIWNADGGEVSACGNATRCVGWLLLEASGRPSAAIETEAGLLQVARAEDAADGAKQVTVDMGVPGLDWRDIPLAEEMDTRGVELQVGPIDDPILHTPGCVSMGNPHVVFFVPDAEAAPVREVGPMIEHHLLFPERANVGFAQIKGRDRIRLRVWERGAGLTKACGTGACAALVAAARRGLTDRKATVEMDGGELVIEWRESDGHVLMTGPVAVEFTGTLKDRAA